MLNLQYRLWALQSLIALFFFSKPFLIEVNIKNDHVIDQQLNII